MSRKGGQVKERFLRPENLADRGRWYLGAFPPRGSIEFEPMSSALLVIDMQLYFLDPDSHSFVPSAPAILPGILHLVDAFEAAGRPVIVTRHVNTKNDAGLMMQWWGELILEDDPLSVLAPELEGRGIQIVKARYDAFFGTGLETALRELGVSQIVITGVMTHLCCETTARSAFVRDIAVFFAVDGTATYNEELHECSVRALAHGFATPVTVEEMLGRFTT